MTAHFGTLTRTLLGLLLLLTLCATPVHAAPPPEDVAATSAGAAGGGCFDLMVNGSFETANFTGWTTAGSPTIIGNGGASGWYSAGLGGRNSAWDIIVQTVACPFVWERGYLTFSVYASTEAPPDNVDDEFVWTTIVGAGPGETHRAAANYALNTWTSVAEFNPAYSSGPWQVSFQGLTDSVYPTWFLIDDVRWVGCCPSDAYESNDTFRAASAVTPGNYNLRLCPSGDEDWFRFDASAGQLIYLGLGITEAGQATVCLVAPDGTDVACDSEVYPNTAILLRTATVSGSWRARVHDPGYLTGGTLLQLGIGLGDLPTPTASPTVPATASPTPTRTATPTRTGVATLTHTAVARPTNTHTRTATPTRTAVATLTRTSTRTPTRTAIATLTPTRTPTRTRTRTPWPTLPGGAKRLSLPLLLRRR